MTTESIILTSPADAGINFEDVPAPVQRPVRREEVLHRCGTHAMLEVAEFFPQADGSLKRTARYVPWPVL